LNHLAHLALSDGTGPSMAGNMMADSIKGRQIDALPPSMREGVRQHRAVDAFTDAHPRVLASIARLKPRWGRYSGIVVDVYYDHLLADSWGRYRATPLRRFLDEAHPLLLAQREHLPPAARDTLERIVLGDRLMSYSDIDGVEAALRRLSAVLARRPPLHEALDDLAGQRDAIEADFQSFFPDLDAFARSLRAARE